jgi:hypothetical protein
MPWQECSKVDERFRFVARLLEGEKMAVLCREFDISRKTGCGPALNIDQGFRTSCMPKQQVAAPVGVQSARRFAVPQSTADKQSDGVVGCTRI